MPFGWKGVFRAVASGGDRLRLPRLRAGDPARRRVEEPAAQHPARGDRLDGHRGRSLYIALQVAFLGALTAGDLSKGWDDVAFAATAPPSARSPASPTALGLSWLATLLYIDAIISPGGTGPALHRHQLAPVASRWPQPLHPDARSRPSARAACRCWRSSSRSSCGMIVFLPFPGWQQLVGFVTVGDRARLRDGAAGARRPAPRRSPTASGRSGCPAAAVLGADRLHRRQRADPVLRLGRRLEAVRGDRHRVRAPRRISDAPRREERPRLDWRPAPGSWPYLIGIGVISYLGSFDTATPSSSSA